jgi:hypothetical protein
MFCLKFLLESLKGKEDSEDLRVDETDFRERGLEGVDWIHLALDRARCRAVVTTVMNFRVP